MLLYLVIAWLTTTGMLVPITEIETPIQAGATSASDDVPSSAQGCGDGQGLLRLMPIIDAVALPDVPLADSCRVRAAPQRTASIGSTAAPNGSHGELRVASPSEELRVRTAPQGTASYGGTAAPAGCQQSFKDTLDSRHLIELSWAHA